MKEKFLFGFNFEKYTCFYEKLGIRGYKYFVPTYGDFWIQLYQKIFNKKINLVSTRKKAVEFATITLIAEAIHYLGLVFLLILNIIVLVQGKIIWTLVIFLMNLFINFFAIILNRYNRIRLIRIFEIQEYELDLTNINYNGDVKK